MAGPSRIALALLMASLLPAPLRSEEGIYLGPATCSATSCHGSMTPRQDKRIPQTEYRTWSGLASRADRHSQAFKVLSDPLGKRIARNLGLESATTARQCLACHEPPVNPVQRGPLFAAGDGVSCEMCHGPAGAWRDSHAAGAPHAENVAKGMVDTKDLARRAATCLQCHLGTADRRVDHELIAAGHPDLTFELDTFTGNIPPHWKVSPDQLAHFRAWAVGQAVQFKAQMDYLVATSREGRWPDYARLDCAACHHPLTAPNDQWRLKQQKLGRKPGRPPFNAAQYAIYRHLARQAAPGEAAALDAAVNGVSATLSTNNPGRDGAAASAARAAELAATVVRKVGELPFDQRLAHRLLSSIAQDGDAIANLGPRAALQSVWALDLLLRVPRAPEGHAVRLQPELKMVMDDLYSQVERVSEFSAPKFAGHMRRLGAYAGNAR